jgi:hypothetical protein
LAFPLPFYQKDDTDILHETSSLIIYFRHTAMDDVNDRVIPECSAVFMDAAQGSRFMNPPASTPNKCLSLPQLAAQDVRYPGYSRHTEQMPISVVSPQFHSQLFDLRFN